MAMPRFLLPTLLSLICGGAAMAADPLTFPWQGRLTVNEIPVTGSHTMVFSLLDSGSTELYNSGPITVQVTEGLAAVLVGGGSMPAIAASVANADGLQMHITLDGTPLSTDIPLVPAFRAHAISDGVVSEAKLDTAAAVKLNALATALSTSTTLGAGAASDTKVPSQLAVKTYVDNAVANGGGGGGGSGVTIDTSATLGSSNTAVPSQLAVKTYVDNGDAALATSITTEQTTRASADTALNTAITTEATTRATAVAAKLDASALATATDLGTGGGGGGASNAKVPSQLAVKTYVDAAVAGGGVAPDTSIQLGASGSSNTVIPSQLAVKTYVDNATTALATSISNEATARGTAVTNEANLRTSADNALNTAVGLKLDSSALDTTPDLGTSGTPSDTKVPSQHAVKTYVDSAVAAVSGATIADGSVSTQKLADGAVTSVKLGNGAVTLAKQANIADGTILGNNTGSAAAPVALDATHIKAVLAIGASDVSGLATVATTGAAADLTGTIATAQIANGAVTLAKQANIADGTILGNNTGSPGAPVALDATHVKTVLAIGAGDVSGLATVATSGAIADLSGTITTAQIANGAVTLAKQANIADGTILGNNTGSPGAPVALDATHVKTVLAIGAGDVSGLATVATSGAIADLSGTVATAQIANGAVTLAKQANIADGTILGNNTGSPGAPIALDASHARAVLGLSTVATSGSAADLSGGQVPAAQMPALTGDVTTSAGAVATTIATSAVTTGKINDGAVTTVKIADGAVTAAKLAPASEGRLVWSSISTDPNPAVANSGYIVTATTSISLPEAALGDRIRVYSRPSNVVTILETSGGDIIDSTGTAGNASVTLVTSAELLCVDATPGAVIWAVTLWN